MADLLLLKELRAHLISNSLVQAQNATPSLTVPSVWLDPKATGDGGLAVKEPVDGENATVTLRLSGGVPAVPFEEFLEVRAVDCYCRARRSEDGELIQRRIKNLLHVNYYENFGDLRVEYVREWRGLSPVMSDANSYMTVQSFLIACRVKSLAGQPLLP